jgi:PLD-like domain
MSKQGSSFAAKGYAGDNKSLLAFSFTNANDAKSLAGFTIQCEPPGLSSYYLFNDLTFATPADHAQVSTENVRSSVNSPFQKYRWTHVPGTNHQGVITAEGEYTYTVTPRYFDSKGSMQALDASVSKVVKVTVKPFKKGALSLGFSRGYIQSGAFVNHFGPKVVLRPAGDALLFDTSQQAGVNKAGVKFTYDEMYGWMGATARRQIFGVLNGVLNDKSLTLDVFAYDLDEPDILKTLLALGSQGRVRIILDNAQLHITHQDSKTHKTVVPPEDPFTTMFQQQAKAPSAIVRGCFDRFSHDKIFIVKKSGKATQVLTGSTNFSMTGLYVNANHVLVFDDPAIAAHYEQVFEKSWTILQAQHTPSTKASNAFASDPLAKTPYASAAHAIPSMKITFSPHTTTDAGSILNAVTKRIKDQESVAAGNGSVLFAVMQLQPGNTPVYDILKVIFQDEKLFSYGISDAPGGTHLYAAGSAKGVLVTGKPGTTSLPPPFDQVPIPPGHEIHDKFVICGLNTPDPVVYCGSSNLALGGEEQNGDNLLEIHDPDVATAFAIEALLLVDHYNFLDRYATKKSGGGSVEAGQPLVHHVPQSNADAAKQVGLSLYTDDKWSLRYFAPGDLHCLDRKLFGAH